MASRPKGKLFRLKLSSFKWLEQEAKGRASNMTAVLDELIDQAASGQLGVSGENAAWLTAEAGRRQCSSAVILDEALTAARGDPTTYYMHLNAVESWTSARLLAALVNGMYGKDQGREIFAAIARASVEEFGVDPRRPSSVQPASCSPQALRRLFTRVPELPVGD